MKFTLTYLIILLLYANHSNSLELSPITEDLTNNHALTLFTELESDSTGSSLLSSIDIQFKTGSEVDSIFNFLMNLKEFLSKSRNENKELILNSERGYNLTLIKYQNSIRFHKEKEEYYRSRIKRYEEEMQEYSQNELYRKTFVVDINLFENLEEKLLNEYKERIEEMENSLESFGIELKKVEEIIKDVLNSKPIAKLEPTETAINPISQKKEYLFNMIKSLQNVKVNSKNKEKYINLLYNTKKKLEKVKTEKQGKLNNLKLEYSNLGKVISNLIKSNKDSFKMSNNNSNNLSSEIDSNKEYKKLLTIHSDSLNSNQNELLKLNTWWSKESLNFRSIAESLLISLKALSKVKKLLLNNFSELKDYLNSRS